MQLSTTKKLLISLVILALLAITLAKLTFSGASFTDQTKNTATFAAGSVAISNSKATAAILDGTYMRPGSSRQGTLTITNNGDYTSALTLSMASLADTPSSPALSAALDLKVEDITNIALPTTLYSGKLGAYTPVSLGNFTTAQAKNYRFTLSWATASPNSSLQGSQTSVTFNWSAQ